MEGIAIMRHELRKLKIILYALSTRIDQIAGAQIGQFTVVAGRTALVTKPDHIDGQWVYLPYLLTPGDQLNAFYKYNATSTVTIPGDLTDYIQPANTVVGRWERQP